MRAESSIWVKKLKITSARRVKKTDYYQIFFFIFFPSDFKTGPIKGPGIALFTAVLLRKKGSKLLIKICEDILALFTAVL